MLSFMQKDFDNILLGRREGKRSNKREWQGYRGRRAGGQESEGGREQARAGGRDRVQSE